MIASILPVRSSEACSVVSKQFKVEKINVPPNAPVQMAVVVTVLVAVLASVDVGDVTTVDVSVLLAVVEAVEATEV